MGKKKENAKGEQSQETEKKTITLEEMEKSLAADLNPRRFRHTQGVRFTAAALAMAHGADLKKAETAGLLHDCAKYLSDEALTEKCKKNGIEISEAERIAPDLLHAKVGAFFAGKKFGIRDEEILSAIRYHTTGRAGMTLLEKIVFVADYIEPGRDKAPRLSEVRETAFRDLDLCIAMILGDTLFYLSDSHKSIDKTTSEAYNFYKEAVRDRLEDRPTGAPGEAEKAEND